MGDGNKGTQTPLQWACDYDACIDCGTGSAHIERMDAASAAMIAGAMRRHSERRCDSRGVVVHGITDSDSLIATLGGRHDGEPTHSFCEGA